MQWAEFVKHLPASPALCWPDDEHNFGYPGTQCVFTNSTLTNRTFVAHHGLCFFDPVLHAAIYDLRQYDYHPGGSCVKSCHPRRERTGLLHLHQQAQVAPSICREPPARTRISPQEAYSHLTAHMCHHPSLTGDSYLFREGTTTVGLPIAGGESIAGLSAQAAVTAQPVAERRPLIL